MIEFRERVVTDVYVGGKLLPLPRQQQAVLNALLAANGEPVSHEQLADLLQCGPRSKMPSVMIAKLRGRLQDHGLGFPILGWQRDGWRWARHSLPNRHSSHALCEALS